MGIPKELKMNDEYHQLNVFTRLISRAHLFNSYHEQMTNNKIYHPQYIEKKNQGPSAVVDKLADRLS